MTCLLVFSCVVLCFLEMINLTEVKIEIFFTGWDGRVGGGGLLIIHVSWFFSFILFHHKSRVVLVGTHNRNSGRVESSMRKQCIDDQ